MSDNLAASETVRNAFSCGDHQDSVPGTLLLDAGAEHPEDRIFGELSLVVRQVPGEFRDIEILTRLRNSSNLAG
ncbi:hypothetical protein [Kitasatospora sp. GP82]|uniref:hypothetical protein n=1 Tax=Kitasatospora sp. GP82 TaxID=3035089 RepID=UPI0024766D8A|nr:hypothetical protein [Kitasatospora sp. GP82]